MVTLNDLIRRAGTPYSLAYTQAGLWLVTYRGKVIGRYSLWDEAKAVYLELRRHAVNA